MPRMPSHFYLCSAIANMLARREDFGRLPTSRSVWSAPCSGTASLQALETWLILRPLNGIVRVVMRRLFYISLAMSLLLVASAFAQTDTLTQANQLELQGEFKMAASAIKVALKNNSFSAPDRKTLEFELDRLD